MSVKTPHTSFPSNANNTSADERPCDTREQWVSLAIAAATASLRASAPTEEAPTRTAWDFDSA